MLAALLAAQAVAAPPPDAPPPTPTAFSVPEHYRLIEGITSDGSTIWLTSVLDRKVIGYRNGRYRELAMPADMGAPLAIAWDWGRGWLWIAAHCPEGLVIPDCRGAKIVGLDRSGRHRMTIHAPNDQPFRPGDLTVWRDRLVVSDSGNGAVYTCTGTCHELRTLVPPRKKGSAQGSVVIDNGRRVLVADYGLGILDVDLATGKETPVLREDGRTLRGVDGLMQDGDGSFLAVRNFDVPGMVVRFQVRDGKLVDLAIAAQGGAIHDPTQLTRDGKRILVVGDGQWAAYLPDKAGKRLPIQRPTPIAAFPAR